jgi:hypothetical protein
MLRATKSLRLLVLCLGVVPSVGQTCVDTHPQCQAWKDAGMSWRRLCTCIAAEPPPYCSHRRGIRCSCADAHRARIYAGHCLAESEHQRFMALSCKASCGLCSTVAPVPVPGPCVDEDGQSLCGTYKAQGARSCCRLLVCRRTSCAYLCRSLPGRKRTPEVYGGEVRSELWLLRHCRTSDQSTDSSTDSSTDKQSYISESLRRRGRPVWLFPGSRCTELLPSMPSSVRKGA